jgi:aspartyl-tRNA(Asn)/glutamyl-tRNA(Gln) amidotransferase subunit C
MAVTIEDVKRVAALARLDLSAREEERLTDELGRILAYMEKLNELDTEGVEPTAHAAPVAGVLRADEPERFAGLAALLAQAPDTRDGYFRVPRIID